MTNEADTCRKQVVPKLQAAGWDNDPQCLQADAARELDALLPAIVDKAFKAEL